MKDTSAIDELLLQVCKLKGTDLHLSVGSVPNVRVLGVLKPLNQYPIIDDTKMQSLLNPLMDALAVSQLNTLGQIDMSYTLHVDRGTYYRFRINLFRQKGSWSGVFRLLNNTIPEFEKLGLPISVLNLYKKRRGLVLVTGVTGSGKSTTLASLLNVINANLNKHIITLEDPIEYIHWSRRSIVSQREIGTDCNSFGDGLRAALREDPDVILIGEMRDLETVQTALQAAETGHLVCSTLHTLGAVETISRILSMFPNDSREQALSQLCSVIEAVVSQQLIPNKDNSGYVVAYEFMYRTPEIVDYIRNRDIKGLEKFMNSDDAVRCGMYSMDYTLMSLYSRGKISKESALDYAFNRTLLQNKINGRY